MTRRTTKAPGRPRQYGTEHTVRFSCRLDPAAYRVLVEYAARRGISCGRAVSEVLRGLEGEKATS